jgi:DNA-binding response OmpR family regulator
MNKKSSPATTPTPLASTAAPRREKRGRILLLEDDEDTRKVLRRLLLARNFEVTDVGTVAEAWECASAGSYHLLLSDIGLPDGDGFRLMRELQELHGLKGIALTGYGLDDDIALSKEAGFSAHIVKPIQIGVLDEALNALLPVSRS